MPVVVPENDGNLQRFIIVLNFSDQIQRVTVHFSENGTWKDLLNDTGEYEKIEVKDYRYDVEVNSNWGRIYFK